MPKKMPPGFAGALIQKFRTARYERNNKRNRWRSDHLDSFVFIHINKTGGTSIKHALKLPWEHLTAQEKKQKLGPAEWDKRFCFSIVRNPWDRVVSQYHYRSQSRSGGFNADEIGFNDWVRQTYGQRNPRYYTRPKFFNPQLDWLSDDKGEVMVDAVYRFETIEDDFRAICSKIGIRTRLSHLRSSNRGDYKGYYEDDTHALIEAWFHRDIDYFGYVY